MSEAQSKHSSKQSKNHSVDSLKGRASETKEGQEEVKRLKGYLTIFA